MIKNQLLYRDEGDELLLVVPKTLQTSVVRQAHEQGNFSVSKTESIIRKDYWFKDLRSKVKKVVANCIGLSEKS